MMKRDDYYLLRDQLVQNHEFILALEQRYMAFLYQAISSHATQIAEDFNIVTELLPFWVNYPPLQRGRSPTGLSIPWLEVGETVIGAHVIRAVAQADSAIRHPGLPSGADLRFLTQDALIHIDIKITGPNDNPDEVVPSPNQLSGDGAGWENEGVVNSPVLVYGNRAKMIFQPELSPFYVINGTLRICLTYFLKGIYAVESLGFQPLDYLDLLCVPNGLLAFQGVNYNETIPGLFIPGKDELEKRKKRVRVRIKPLEQIAHWRRKRIWERKMLFSPPK